MNFSKIIHFTFLLYFWLITGSFTLNARIPEPQSHETHPSEPFLAPPPKDHPHPDMDYAVWVLNWTPRPEKSELPVNWALDQVIGRRFLHASILITERAFDLHSQVDEDGNLHFDKEMVRDYMSYPSYDDLEDDIQSYLTRKESSVNSGDVIFEAIKVGHTSGNKVDEYTHKLIEDGYKLPKDLMDLFETFRGLTTQINDKRLRPFHIKSIYKKLNEDPQKTALELKSAFQIEASPQEVANYIAFDRDTKEYRAKWTPLTNNCSNVTLKGLRLLFDHLPFHCDKDMNAPYNVVRDCVVPHVEDPIFYTFIGNGAGGIAEIQQSYGMNEDRIDRLEHLTLGAMGAALASFLAYKAGKKLLDKNKSNSDQSEGEQEGKKELSTDAPTQTSDELKNETKEQPESGAETAD